MQMIETRSNSQASSDSNLNRWKIRDVTDANFCQDRELRVCFQMQIHFSRDKCTLSRQEIGAILVVEAKKVLKEHSTLW